MKTLKKLNRQAQASDILWSIAFIAGTYEMMIFFNGILN